MKSIKVVFATIVTAMAFESNTVVICANPSAPGMVKILCQTFEMGEVVKQAFKATPVDSSFGPDHPAFLVPAEEVAYYNYAFYLAGYNAIME